MRVKSLHIFLSTTQSEYYGMRVAAEHGVLNVLSNVFCEGKRVIAGTEFIL